VQLDRLELAEVPLFFGLARQESRGAHARTDCPKCDDEKFLFLELCKKVIAVAKKKEAVLSFGFQVSSFRLS
jgi:succinate dehydrogenase/fumarate reductase flavoprotein subunit